MNNRIIEQITESINVVTEEKIKHLKFDSTKRGKVINLYDNSCIVEIDGSNYICKIKDGINFNINDTVFVKIPNNNFSDKYVDGKLGYLGESSGGGEVVSMMWADIIGKPNSLSLDIDDSVSKKHEHNNLTLLQTITQTLIDRWNSAWEHISDSVKHITTTERSLINNAEPSFVKNSAFNKNFGTNINTVAEGNHTHTLASLSEKNYDSLNNKPLDDNFNTLPSLLESTSADELLVYDSINGSYKKITKQNLLSGIANNDEYVFISHTEEFTASEGQTIFNLNKGVYTINADRISVYMYGMLQPPNSYIETSSASITLKQGLSEGTRVVTKYISVTNVMDYIHAQNHAIGGADTITPSMIGAEPIFTKNSAFNKNFGTTIGTVSEGSHSHIDLHSHSNKSILDNITQILINAWNSAVEHISDVAKHITIGERTLWNTVSNKVDKIEGKDLSSNDFTNVLKLKLDGVESNANNYTHPITHPPSIITQDENNRLVTDVQQVYWNVKQDALGFVPVNKAGDTIGGNLGVDGRLTIQGGMTFQSYGQSIDFNAATLNNITSLSTRGATPKFMMDIDYNGYPQLYNHGFTVLVKNKSNGYPQNNQTFQVVDNQDVNNKQLLFGVKPTGQVNALCYKKLDGTEVSYDGHIHDQYVTQQDLADLGAGDMLKNIYDTNNNGKVDIAENAEQFAGQLPSYYTSKVYTDTELGKKVDKVTGKQLSTNDYTTTEKNKLANIESNANNYIHPVGTNPHGTTKSDVGLGNVGNYALATQVEAEAGTSNVKYMTPLRTKEAIESNKMFYVGNTIPTNKNLLWVDTSVPINL